MKLTGKDEQSHEHAHAHAAAQAAKSECRPRMGGPICGTAMVQRERRNCRRWHCCQSQPVPLRAALSGEGAWSWGPDGYNPPALALRSRAALRPSAVCIKPQ